MTSTKGRGATVIRQPSGAERDPVAYARRRRTLELILGVSVPVALLALWQIAGSSGHIDRLNYPPPSDIVTKMRQMFRSQPGGHYWADVWVSSKRVLWGSLWGTLSGLVIGYVMGMSRWVRAALDPMLTALYTVPKLALLGVFLFAFGFGEKPVIAIVTVTVFFFVWISTMAAVLSVPEGLREAARSFGSNRWDVFRHVILPSSLPQVFVGLRIAAGVAVLTMIGVEFAYAPGTKGVGYRINNARQIFDPKQAYVGLVVAALMGVLFSSLVKALGRALTPWAPKDESGR